MGFVVVEPLPIAAGYPPDSPTCRVTQAVTSVALAREYVRVCGLFHATEELVGEIVGIGLDSVTVIGIVSVMSSPFTRL